MRIFDRLTGRCITEKDLPRYIDLGRYFLVEAKADLTNRVINVGTDKFINQSLLDSKNKSIQDLFCFFYAKTLSDQTGGFSITPLIQSVKDKLYLNEFEEILEAKLFHLEKIFRQPHYLLQRAIEKVNVSRAKRIPPESYQNLASHTEDWTHKSIIDFKPRRILNEELDSEYDVYENQITLALVMRCIRYLSGRIQEVNDISAFLGEYENLLKKRKDDAGWYKKISRNLKMFGDVYKDENYSDELSKEDTLSLSKTQQKLNQMFNRLKTIQNSALCSELNQRTVASLMSEVDVRPTNVIANHCHYRYVRDIWLKLNECEGDRSEEKMGEYEQEVIGGVRNYSEVIFAYIVKKILGYEMTGNYSRWKSKHGFFADITFEVDDNNIIRMSIGENSVSFVVFASAADVSEEEIPSNTYILSLSRGNISSEKILRIDPYDADSVERVGRVVKSYIIRDFVAKYVKCHYEYPHFLRDYLGCIKTDSIVFGGDFTYSIKDIPDFDLQKKDALDSLVNDAQYKKKSRPDQDRIKKGVEDLVDGINQDYHKLIDSLRCPYCLGKLQRRQLKQLNYIQCECGFVLDSSTSHVVFKNKEEKYSDLKTADWGMDYVEYTD